MPQAETQNIAMSSRKENISAQVELTGIILCVVAESKAKNLRFSYEYDLTVTKKIMSHPKVMADIGDIVRMSNFDE